MRVLGKQDSMRVPGEQVKVATAEVIKAPPTTVKCEEASSDCGLRGCQDRWNDGSRNSRGTPSGSGRDGKANDGMRFRFGRTNSERNSKLTRAEENAGLEKRTQSKVQVIIQQKSCRIAGRGRWTAVDGEAGGERAKSSVTGKEERDNQVMMARGQP